MIVKTKYVSNAQGRGQVIAKSQGKQRTVSYDASKSNDWNHGNAAGVLIDALGVFTDNRLTMYRTGAVSIFHQSSDDGCQHTFSL